MKYDQEDIETTLPDGNKHKIGTVMTSAVEATTNSIIKTARKSAMNTGY